MNELLGLIIRISQHTPLKGRGGYGPFNNRSEDSLSKIDLGPGESEYQNAKELIKLAPVIKELISEKVVLDFGSGYGGKTVYYSKFAIMVYGTEPFSTMVDYSRDFASLKESFNTAFEVCEDLKIPFNDQRFDSVISHDVLEHVANPSASLAEIFRVLKPGGKAIVIFPSYDGAFSHHLDYITLVPCLHWFFKPVDIVSTVNRCLLSIDCNTGQQPNPKISWDGKRYVLPTLNGLTYKDFLVEAQKNFEVTKSTYIPIGYKNRGVGQRLAKSISSILMLFSKERFAMSGVFELRKPYD